MEKRNVEEKVFELELAEAGFVTVTLGSLDFDALLVVRDPKTGAQTRDGGSWRHSDAWLYHEAKTAGTLLVRVAAEDDRGGEFVLSARLGRFDPLPPGGERFREALEQCEAIAKRAEEKGDVPRAARFLGSASRAAFVLGGFEKARSLALRQLERAEAKGLTDETLLARRNLGVAERRLGNYDRAQELLQGSLSEVEGLLAAVEDPRRAPVLAILAISLCDDLGDLVREKRGQAEALPLRRKALEFLARTGRPDFESVLWCKLGDELSALGQVPEARSAIEKGLAVAERLGIAPLLAQALLSHGRFLERHGSSTEARAQCERALTLPPIPVLRLEILGTLANALIDLGRYEQAVAALDEVEALAREIGSDDYEIPIRITRARIAYDVFNLPRAHALLEEARAIQEASGSPLHRVDVLLMLGLVLADQGHADEARTRYEEALETCEQTGELERQGRVLVDLGMLHEKRHDYDMAMATYIQAEDIGRKAGSATVEAFASCGRAYMLFLKKDLADSKVLAQSVAAKLEALGEMHAAVDTHDTLARIGLASGDLGAVDEAVCAADRLFQQQEGQRLDRFAAAGLRSRFADWGGVAQDLVAQRARAEELSAQKRDALVLDGWRTAGRWKGRILLDSMHEREGATTAADPPMPRVGKRTAIVEYVEGLEKLYAYVALADAVRLVELGPREPLEERARKYVDTLSILGAPPATVAADGAWLYEHLASPIQALLPAEAEIATLVIVPSPALAALPFEALVRPTSDPGPDERGFDKLHYLIDDFAVVYAPSSPVLADLQRRGARGGEPRFLVLGDPVYATEVSGAQAVGEVIVQRPGSGRTDYGRLKSTKKEALVIVRLLLRGDPARTDKQSSEYLELESNRDGTMTASHFDVRLGSEVGVEVLKKDLLPYSGIHIAAHGEIDPDDPRRSALVLSYEPRNGGKFWLEDVLGLRLDTDIVVLSACDTARGPVLRGEGVQSLACGFLQAGSRSVVATLWKLEDDDAADIMDKFYTLHLKDRFRPAVALQKAKLEFRHSTKVRGKGVNPQGVAQVYVAANPYYWAPFVYVGAVAE